MKSIELPSPITFEGSPELNIPDFTANYRCEIGRTQYHEIRQWLYTDMRWYDWIDFALVNSDDGYTLFFEKAEYQTYFALRFG